MLGLRGRRKAEGGRMSGIFFPDLKKVCELHLQDMRERFGKLKGLELMDLELWRELADPNLFSQEASYHYMGRRFTGNLIRFIMEDLNAPIYFTRRSPGLIKYISGTPGYGKTVSLSTAFTYLYLRSVKAMEERQMIATEDLSAEEGRASATATVSESNTQWNPDSYDVSEHRFLLLSCSRFVRDPCESLYGALVMAYIKDPESLATLQKLDSESERDLSWFLSLRSETVHIILDEGNALDEEDTAKSSALEFLLSLQKSNVKLTICASVRSKLRKLVLKESAKYHIGAGGFSEEEVCKFISRVTGEPDDERVRKRARLMYESTGWVPMLVAQFISNKQAYRDSIERHALDLYHYIRQVEEEKRPVEMMQLLTAIAGGDIRPLSDALDARCFYRGQDGKAHCLTPSLHSRAVGLITERAQNLTLLTGLESVDHFTRVIATDTNLVRIGWNSEAAALLAMQLLKAYVPGLDLVIEPNKVRIFKGRFTRELTQVRDKVLFIPERFNHGGADVYYVTPDAVLVIQITVGVNPEKNHPKTEEVARTVFDGENRLKAVVWNVVTDRSRMELPSAEADFYRVYVPFGELHSSLADIDRRVTELRRLRSHAQGARCPVCNEGGPRTQVLCGLCGIWFHTNCVSVGDLGAAWYCAECEERYQEECEEEAEDPDDPDYE